jgi:hypothetical protein
MIFPVFCCALVSDVPVGPRTVPHTAPSLSHAEVNLSPAWGVQETGCGKGNKQIHKKKGGNQQQHMWPYPGLDYMLNVLGKWGLGP